VDGQVRDNQARRRFELEVGGDIVFADYRRLGSVLAISWVEAAPRLRGTGAADRLMRGIADIAEAKGWEIEPLCGYAAAWLRRHYRHRKVPG
jgi:uncharacterized protein